ncbi:HAD-superfamily subfamily IB hydrolase, TIGR01490 [Clostridium cavendishii DSM 21758]|uniref:HAD-superfamily subfamily IB hydrolase, TIGR01490 n=1 Tax=Clostridium cavendishii DSM 21758 TaxID=1121302 RepID=A0A1M6B6C9_9CLOT|nr:HAD-IB family hydrolase [Clostridium cavendishii]SHI44207.1 HAD-superfamily subfamily IB hydrolase, TIGR01490 [Clostridium cavendishii DSM 21758]
MEKLALFDVDFTITRKETLLEFFKFVISKDKKNVKFIPRAIFCGVMYGIGVYDEKKVKEAFIKFIDNIEENDLKLLVREYYKDHLSNILYEDAITMIRKLKSEGYKVYLISASPEFYLYEFYNIKEVDKIIGTKFKFNEGKLKREMEGLNCKGEEKVRRLMEVIKEEGIEVDFKNSYMFSDSLSDKPLLDLVGKPYLINFKKKHDTIEILNWK